MTAKKKTQPSTKNFLNNKNTSRFYIEKLKELAQISHIEKRPKSIKDIFFPAAQNQGLAVPECHTILYRNIIAQLYSATPEIYETISLDNFLRSILELVFLSLQGQEEISEDTVKQCLSNLLGKSLEKWEVFTRIFGIEANMNQTYPVILGPYKIYSLSAYKARFPKENDYRVQQEILEASNEPFPPFWISICNLTRDPKLAQNKAIQPFQQFENIMSYMIANRQDAYRVHILSPRTDRLLEMTAVAGAKIYKSMKRKGQMWDIDISHPWFTDHNNGNHYIWTLVGKESPNEMQKRLLDAVVWIGKGISDQDDARTFVQCTFAIERLLKASLKGLINSSIAHQLSESVAFILEDDFSKRMEMCKKVKDLYGIRSGIAHGGEKEEITKEDLGSILEIARRLVRKMATDEELLKLTHVSPTKKGDEESLAFYVEKKRFGS